MPAKFYMFLGTQRLSILRSVVSCGKNVIGSFAIKVDQPTSGIHGTSRNDSRSDLSKLPINPAFFKSIKFISRYFFSGQKFISSVLVDPSDFAQFMNVVFGTLKSFNFFGWLFLTSLVDSLQVGTVPRFVIDSGSGSEK